MLLTVSKETGYKFFLGHIDYFVPKRDGIGKTHMMKLILRRLGYKQNKRNINALSEKLEECIYDSENSLLYSNRDGHQFAVSVIDDREGFVRMQV